MYLTQPRKRMDRKISIIERAIIRAMWCVCSRKVEREKKSFWKQSRAKERNAFMRGMKRYSSTKVNSTSSITHLPTTQNPHPSFPPFPYPLHRRRQPKKNSKASIRWSSPRRKKTQPPPQTDTAPTGTTTFSPHPLSKRLSRLLSKLFHCTHTHSRHSTDLLRNLRIRNEWPKPGKFSTAAAVRFQFYYLKAWLCVSTVCPHCSYQRMYEAVFIANYYPTFKWSLSLKTPESFSS